MAGLWGWVASEWRRSWRSLVLLALLVAFGGAIAIASIAGARLAGSAFDDFSDETSAPLEVSIAGASNDFDMFEGALELADEIAATPGVQGVTPISWMGVAAEADNGATMPAFAVATLRGAGDRPPLGAVAVDGRLPDPSSPDEVVINEVAAQLFAVGVGDSLTLHTYALDQAADMISATRAPFKGPTLTGVVVGVVRTAEDVSDNSEPILYLTHAFRETYGNQIVHCDCTFWVRAEPEDVAAVSAALPSMFGDYRLVAQPVSSSLSARVDDAVGLEVGALRIAALIGTLASALVVAQAIARHIGAERGGSSALVALGAQRRDVVRAWTVMLLPVAVAGSLGAALAAIAVSPVLPRGLARQAVVHPGVHVDAPVVVGGMVVVLLVTIALARLVAQVMVGRVVERPGGRVSSGSAALVLHTRPTVALGANLAIDPARDRARLTAVSAVSGLALAIAAVMAVGLIDVSTNQVLRSPASFAADWDMQFSEQPDDAEALLAATTAEPIEALAISKHVSGNTVRVTASEASGLASPGALLPVLGSMGPFIDHGQPATTGGDAVLGPALADQLGVDVGDTVTVATGNNGDQEFVVTGIGRLADGDETGEAFVVTPDGLERMQAFEKQSTDGAYLRLGDADDGAQRRLTELGWEPVVPPSSVANLGEIGSVPHLLALALCALGLGGATHSLLVAARKRRHDLAVASSLGFTRNQVAATMRWQGVLTGAAATLIGLPLGALLGRVIWKQVADGAGAVDLVSVPWTVMLLVPVITIAAVGGIASIVGHRTARLDPARTLRGE